MSAAAAPSAAITCSRCSRVTTDAAKSKWRFTDPPLVVQGVALGLCWSCQTGEAPPAEGEKSCDGSCSGDYRPQRGTYYEAVWGDGYGFSGEKHACWDPACVEAWADDQDSDCDHCGQSVDVAVYTFTDGKRVRAGMAS